MTSVGLLHSIQRLLRLVESERIVLPVDPSRNQKYLGTVDAGLVLEEAQKCRWLTVDAGGYCKLTDAGKTVILEESREIQLRIQLLNIIEFVNPAWAKKLADGRTEAEKFLPDEIAAIFKESGLLGEWSDDLITWWDRLALAARSHKNEFLLAIGRKAERLSFSYEFERTGRKPKWQSLNSNYSGFDILSSASRDDQRLIPIEVKGTVVSLKEAMFSVTRNEWNVASKRPGYTFHLWLIRDGEEVRPSEHLRVVSLSEIQGHICRDVGDGKWETLRIPYKVFWQAA